MGYASTPIIQTTYQVSNVLDVGYMPNSSSPWQFWALDNYTETLTVWSNLTVPGTYAVNVTDIGQWCTLAAGPKVRMEESRNRLTAVEL